jgi:hypothetical protein
VLGLVLVARIRIAQATSRLSLSLFPEKSRVNKRSEESLLSSFRERKRKSKNLAPAFDLFLIRVFVQFGRSAVRSPQSAAVMNSLRLLSSLNRVLVARPAATTSALSAHFGSSQAVVPVVSSRGSPVPLTIATNNWFCMSE